MTEITDWKKIPLGHKSLEERDPSSVKIVIGMTGSMDSAVAAFLLKKRGLQVIGLSLVFLNEEEIIQSVKDRRDEILEQESLRFDKAKGRGKLGSSLEDDTKFLLGNCSVKNLDKVRGLCDFLEIPFYAVNAQQEFHDLIMDPLISSKISGDIFYPCIGCNNLKIEILLQKAQTLHADFVATGHYAKIFKMEKNQTYHLFHSNDKDNDQSYFLSKLEQYHLARLVLPLSELRKQEVQKVAEKYRLPCEIRRDSKKICFLNGNGLPLFVDSSVHEKLRPGGVLIDKKHNKQIGEHYGLQYFSYGEKNLESRQIKFSVLSVDKNMEIGLMEYGGKIYIGQEQDFLYAYCSVIQLQLAPELDVSRPILLCVKISPQAEKVPATLFFKNNQTGMVEFSQKLHGLAKGQLITFYNHNKLGAKIIGSGHVYFLGHELEGLKVEKIDSESHSEEEQIQTSARDHFKF